MCCVCYMYLQSPSKKRFLHYYFTNVSNNLYKSYFCVQVGPPDMFDTHQQLIELRKQEKELEVIS